MEQIVLVVHLLIALAIIGLIMMQRGKGADIGASFGGGGSQTLFGSTGSGNALTRMTAWLATAFFISSFALAVIANNRSAGDDELGFELPVEAASAPALESDLPQVDVGDELPGASQGIDSGDELPEG